MIVSVRIPQTFPFFYIFISWQENHCTSCRKVQFNCDKSYQKIIDHAGHSKCSRVIYILSCVIHRLNLTETVIWALSLWTVQIARVLGVISRPPTENSCQSHNGGDHHSTPLPVRGIVSKASRLTNNSSRVCSCRLLGQQWCGVGGRQLWQLVVLCCFLIRCNIKSSWFKAIYRDFLWLSINHHGKVLICPTEDLEWTSVGTSQRASVAIPTNINMGCLMEIPGHIRLWRPMGPRRNELLGLHGMTKFWNKGRWIHGGWCRKEVIR